MTITVPLQVTQLLRPTRGLWSPKGPAACGAEMCMRRRVGSAPPRGLWSRLGPRPAVPLRTAPCSSSVAHARPTVPVGPAAGGASRSMLLSAGHAESLMA